MKTEERRCAVSIIPAPPPRAAKRAADIICTFNKLQCDFVIQPLQDGQRNYPRKKAQTQFFVP